MKPYYQRGLCTLYHGDCRDILPMIGEVDAVVTEDAEISKGNLFAESDNGPT